MTIVGRTVRDGVTRLGVIAVLAVALVTAGSDPAAANRDLVRLSIPASPEALPAIVAVERGLMDQEDIIVSVIAQSDMSAVARSVGAGSSDVAVLPQHTFLSLTAQGLDLRVIGVAAWSPKMELIARGGTGVGSVADLRGRRIGVSSGSKALPYLVRLVNLAGLRADEVEIQVLPLAQLSEGFTTGAVDAVFDVAATTSAIAADAPAESVLDPEQVTNELGVIGAAPLVAGARSMERQPEAVQRFVNGWVKAMVYIQQDPEDAQRLLTIFLHRVGASEAEQTAQRWMAAHRYDLYTWSEEATLDAQYNAWGLHRVGALAGIPDMTNMVENRFAESAAAPFRN